MHFPAERDLAAAGRSQRRGMHQPRQHSTCDEFRAHVLAHGSALDDILRRRAGGGSAADAHSLLRRQRQPATGGACPRRARDAFAHETVQRLRAELPDGDLFCATQQRLVARLQRCLVPGSAIFQCLMVRGVIHLAGLGQPEQHRGGVRLAGQQCQAGHRVRELACHGFTLRFRHGVEDVRRLALKPVAQLIQRQLLLVFARP